MKMARKIDPKCWAELGYKDSIKGASVPEYLAYLLRKLTLTLDMYDALQREFPLDHAIQHSIRRERHVAVEKMIRLQSGLRWDVGTGTVPYVALAADPGNLQIDHVIEAKDMAREIVAASPDERSQLFVRAWLAPVCRIPSEIHRKLPASTASLTAGFPFKRYAGHLPAVFAFGVPIEIERYGIEHHFARLGESRHFAAILDHYGIPRCAEYPG
jgi:hypothetical protein